MDNATVNRKIGKEQGIRATAKETKQRMREYMENTCPHNERSAGAARRNHFPYQIGDMQNVG